MKLSVKGIRMEVVWMCNGYQWTDWRLTLQTVIMNIQ